MTPRSRDAPVEVVKTQDGAYLRSGTLWCGRDGLWVRCKDNARPFPTADLAEEHASRCAATKYLQDIPYKG